jgi:hypothetical protein
MQKGRLSGFLCTFKNLTRIQYIFSESRGSRGGRGGRRASVAASAESTEEQDPGALAEVIEDVEDRVTNFFRP